MSRRTKARWRRSAWVGLVALLIPSAARANDEKPNCLIIVLDAMGARHMSLYGAHDATTPFLESIRGASVVFSQAHSQQTSTRTSVTSYFTGLYPYPSGRPKPGNVSDATPMLAELFHDAGYTTAAFSDNPWVRQRTVGRGFDSFAEVDWRGGKKSKESLGQRDESATDELIGHLKGFLDTREDGPWFAYFHMVKPHNPYFVDPRYRRLFSDEVAQFKALTDEELAASESSLAMGVARNRNREVVIDIGEDQLDLLRRLYRGNVRSADARVQEIFEHLAANGQLDHTLVIVMADHGEAFLEHGDLLHNTTPYEELIHVPLIFHYPADPAFAAKTIDIPVEMVDLVPTLSDMFGLQRPQVLDGTSMLPLMAGLVTQPKEVYYSGGALFDAIAVRKGPYKFIYTPEFPTHPNIDFELYDLSTDPMESNNLYGSTEKSISDVSFELRELAQAFLTNTRVLGATDAPVELTDEEKESLRSLGYVE